MSTARPSWTERALRRLVRWLPADFRSDFGPSIEADLADRGAAGDRAGLVRRDFPSLLAILAREHASVLAQDAKYAVRTLRRTPAFTALAVLMLALGTGVNVAMFSVVDAVMLRSPFRERDRIVQVLSVIDGRRTAAFSPERFSALEADPGPFAHAAALALGQHIVTGSGDPFSPDVECVSSAMFQVLGTPPLLGRVFSRAEDRPGASPTIVLSFDLWQRLGGSNDVLGTRLTVNQTPVTVVGVMPPEFAGPYSRSDVQAWLPLSRPVAGGGSAGCGSARTGAVLARLHDGQTLDTARARFSDLDLISIQEQTYGDYQTPLLILAAAVGCVLLIACLNVGGLQMERSLARRREMALRLALGASRARLVRQTLTESLLLALVGGAAGVAAAWFTLRGIVSMLPGNLPYLGEIALNARGLVVALAAASTAGVVSGLVPIGSTRRASPAAAFAGAARTTAVQRSWARQGLVLSEVGLSIVVLIGAALMVQTFLTLRPTQPGFDVGGKQMLIVRLPGRSGAESARFYGRLFDRLARTPGIRRAEGTRVLPMVFGNARILPVTFGDATASTNINLITPGYLELMKIPLRAGRAFTALDTSASMPVAIVNETLARRIRPDGQVLGERISTRDPVDANAPLTERVIVGVAGDVRTARYDTQPRREAYIPYAQEPTSTLVVVAEAEGGAEHAVGLAMREAVRALDQTLVLEEPRSMAAELSRTVQHWRFQAWLLGAFAGLAILLAAIGLMTTIGWWVHQRTRELGLRVALGATRGRVVRLVLRQGLTLAGLGIAAGSLAAMGLTGYLESSLYGVTPLDPKTFVGCAAGMLLVAVAAVLAPVRRAISVDPVVALRAE